MRENRPSGSEGGGTELNRFSLPLSFSTASHDFSDEVRRRIKERGRNQFPTSALAGTR